jgi:3-deoxy-D-manno-octulosonic acid (KDO) 8-phosphate synthase
MNDLYNQLNNPSKLFFLTGPCAVENEKVMDDVAKELVRLREKFDIPIVFKASFKKANRSRLDSFTGIGNEKAITLLSSIAAKYKLPTIVLKMQFSRLNMLIFFRFQLSCVDKLIY